MNHRICKTLPYFNVIILVFTLLSLQQVAAQSDNKATLKGQVLDSLSATPLGFASIRVFSAAEKKLVNGNITSEAGAFSITLPFGHYYSEVEFMGYGAYTSSSFILSAATPEHDLGIIRLSANTSTLKEVTVEAQKSMMQLSLDKKIFNVGQDLANTGGSATDVLMNVPSVSVDPEGNIKLRGSDNVRILIDGKPSGLVSFKGGSGLQQLQASMIERVEVITNPSARYEAEGMAGIINIVLKKERNQGFNGSFELITGTPTNFGGAANLNYRHKKVNFFINYGIAYRVTPGTGKLYQEVNGEDSLFILKQSNKNSITGFNNNIRGGLDFYFTETSILTGSYLFRRSDVNRITDIRYEDYLNDPGNLRSYTLRRQDEDETEPNSEYSLIYKKSFGEKDHDLIAEVKFLDNWESSDQLFTQNRFANDGTEAGTVQTSLNDEFEKTWLFQLDYIQPIGKEGKFETGVRSSFRDMVNDYVVSERNASGEYVPMAGLDNVFVYNENIHAVYGILGNKQKKISYQAGLRAEWTDVKTTLRETNEVNPRKYTNLFPSGHFTVDLPRENAVQLSYSRRVRRPFYNDLSPFMTFSDSRNFFSGNPDLNPEFSNVFEVGHLKYFEKGSLSSSVYYRSTDGKIDRIRTVNDQGNSVTITENLKSENAYGIELTGDYSPARWWKLDLNINFFHADIDGSNIIETYKATTYSWFARQTSRFTLPGNFDIQLRANYEAPQKTAQGRRKSLYFTDFSTSKDILKGRGTLYFSVLDIFNSRRMRTITRGENFYTDSNFLQRRRQINFTMTYRIRQAKVAKKMEE
ncbi:TonB-dependent receptor [Fulvivirgaceae bacterium PWU4]|uniref:TonB-dependent receptor n=1 Tax=Chryseosolibacter histidini TaxID=2782349 RepID=A0AAP2DIE5_9BACT|nr:outer membrane beta-barrel family protein [Chryseosolibacter histidini]MBT1695592.1 TonB-dependent receptor [Chryseosolibacter histidini]